MNSTDGNAEIVLFLGAGASSFAGYRIFAAFPDLIFDDEIRKQEELGELHNTTRSLLHEVESSLRIQGKATTHDNFLWALNDYTRLWYVLRIDDVLRSRFVRGTTQWSEFAHFCQTVEDAIFDLTLSTVRHYAMNRIHGAQRCTGPTSNIMRRVFDLYAALAAKNNRRTPFLPVFTTNYDLLLEDLIQEYGHLARRPLMLVNGFPDRAEESAWSAEEYERYPGGLQLHRLHGCACWFCCEAPDRRRIEYHRQNCSHYPITNLCALYPGHEPLRGLNPYAFSFKRLHAALLGCRVIVFIGFSFRDDDVAHVLLSANAQRPDPLRIVILDPTLTATDVVARLDQAGRTTQYPIRLPAEREVKHINARFGYADFDRILMDVVDQTLGSPN